MKTIKKIPIFLVIISILFVPFTLCASAVDFTFEYDIAEPVSSEYTGYIVVPYTDASGNFYDTCYFWVITPTISNDNVLPVVSWNYSASNNSFDLTISTNQSGHSYFFSLYSISSGSTIIHQYSGNVTYSNAYTYSRTYKSSYMLLRPQFKNITVIGDWPTIIYNYNILWAEDSVIYNELLEANSKLAELLISLDLTNEQLKELYSLLNQYLKNIDKNTTSLVSLLDQFYYEWYQWSWTEQGYYDRIVELLEQAIEGEKPSNQDSMQDSYDDFADIEQDLLDNEDASNAIGNFDVTIDGDSFTFIWNTITDFLNSHSKVFGLFIACLTLAFIALLLHR